MMKTLVYDKPAAGLIWLLAVSACGGHATPDGFVSGSSNMAAFGEAVFVADGDNGALARVHVDSGDVESLVLGAEPTRVARIGSTIYVTLRADRSVAVVAVKEDGTMALQGVHTVGAEPYGVVAAPDGQSIFVALSVEGAIVQLDAETLEQLARFEVDGEPRWLAMAPSGRYLFIGTARGQALVQLDLKTGETRAIEAPPVERGDEMSGEVVVLVPRVTGDPVISDDGGTLAVPFIYVDVQTSVGPADPTKEDEPAFDEEDRVSSGGYAAGNVEGLTRFNPAVVTVPLTPGGAAKDGVKAVLVAGQSDVDGLLSAPEIPSHGEDHGFGGEPLMFDTAAFATAQGGFTRVRGYLSSLAFSPDGHMIFGTVEGGRSVVAVAAKPVQSGTPFGEDDDIFFGDGAFDPTPRVFVGTDHGPSGLVRTSSNELLTYSFIGRSLSSIPMDDVEDGMEVQTLEQVFMPITWHAGKLATLEPSKLPPGVQDGRRLFYSSSDGAMAAAGAGVSCATCHFEGRNDGLTWKFDSGLRQTPTLAGKVSTTAPITWTNDVDTVVDEVRITSQGRMGGHGLTERQMLDVASFIDWTRDVDVPLLPAHESAVARGRAIFEREDVACATCHTGERLTDNQSYTMFGETSINTPPLTGLVVTGPYLHDGSAKTLRDVVDMADAGGMGHTAQLSETEKQDLVRYLESL